MHSDIHAHKHAPTRAAPNHSCPSNLSRVPCKAMEDKGWDLLNLSILSHVCESPGFTYWPLSPSLRWCMVMFWHLADLFCWVTTACVICVALALLFIPSGASTQNIPVHTSLNISVMVPCTAKETFFTLGLGDYWDRCTETLCYLHTWRYSEVTWVRS